MATPARPSAAGSVRPGTDPGAAGVVRAYGGVVWDRDGAGVTRFVVVHRPRHRDWSFPKGKVDPGERPEDTARREVEEETGLQCSLGRYLGEATFAEDDGTVKVVGYWTMRVGARRPRPADAEVDEVRWWTAEEAARRLTHRQDRDLLARVLAALALIDPGAAPDPGAVPAGTASAASLPPVMPGPGDERTLPA